MNLMIEVGHADGKRAPYQYDQLHAPFQTLKEPKAETFWFFLYDETCTYLELQSKVFIDSSLSQCGV